MGYVKGHVDKGNGNEFILGHQNSQPSIEPITIFETKKRHKFYKSKIKEFQLLETPLFITDNKK